MKIEYTIEQLEIVTKQIDDFNLKNNITGLMIYYDRNVIQYIEGEEDVIKNIFKKIQIDNRHINIIKLIEEVLLERRMYDWKLFFKDKSNYTFLDVVESHINNIKNNNSLIKLFNIFIKINIRYI